MHEIARWVTDRVESENADLSLVQTATRRDNAGYMVPRNSLGSRNTGHLPNTTVRGSQAAPSLQPITGAALPGTVLRGYRTARLLVSSFFTTGFNLSDPSTPQDLNISMAVRLWDRTS